MKKLTILFDADDMTAWLIPYWTLWQQTASLLSARALLIRQRR